MNLDMKWTIQNPEWTPPWRKWPKWCTCPMVGGHRTDINNALHILVIETVASCSYHDTQVRRFHINALLIPLYMYFSIVGTKKKTCSCVYNIGWMINIMNTFVCITVITCNWCLMIHISKSLLFLCYIFPCV